MKKQNANKKKNKKENNSYRKVGGTGHRLCQYSYYHGEIHRENTPLQYRDPFTTTHTPSQWRKDHPKLKMTSSIHDITRWKYSKQKDIKRKKARKKKHVYFLTPDTMSTNSC